MTDRLVPRNIILQTDSYKLTHWRQYPEGTTGVYSYFESRNGAKWPYTVFFGLQQLLMEYLEGSVVTPLDLDYAEMVAAKHFGGELFNVAGWAHIINDHDGALPLHIRAVPEGSIIPQSNVMLTIENTCPKCFWLTNYIETLLTHVWYPSTVATLSHSVKMLMKTFLLRSADTLDALPFMLHDFGYRGATSEEAAQIGGAAHLVNFSGTDTLAGMVCAHEYYDAPYDDLAFSVPATEHSVMTALGAAGEMDVLDSLLKNYPTGILSVVGDSYDIYEFTDQVCARKDQILARDGRFVLRPDSITLKHTTPQELCVDLLDRLWATYRGTVNSKGCRVLDDHIRLLWGDGINDEGIGLILDRIVKAGFSAECMVFGMGGGLLQKVNRDTQRFAFKSSAQRRGDVWYPVQKKPLDETKASKAGRLKLVRDVNGHLVTLPEEMEGIDMLEDVFLNGEVLREQTFAEIRHNANP